MKKYNIYSKIIIAVCICLLFVTVFNFFTGMINSTMPGSSHVLCASVFSGVIALTIAEEKRRMKKLNE